MQRIGVVTAGGDAPGMNAAIRSIVRTAIFHGLEVMGIERGYTGLIEGQTRPLSPRSVSGIINLGGTILKTARCEEMKSSRGIRKAADVLKTHGIEGLIVIGGDGSFRGASELHRASGLPMIGVPATIDNDVNGVDLAIGADTAVNVALDALDKIRDTARSHGRVFLVEVMGRHAGYIALDTGIAAGAEDILIPEVTTDVSMVAKKLSDGIERGWSDWQS